MKPKSIIMTFLLCAAVFSASMVGYISGVQANKKQDMPQSAASSQAEKVEDIFPMNNVTEPENVVQDFTETYVLREKDGQVALFIRYTNGDEQFYSSYDVSVNLLPKNDREELAAGIELNTLSDALQLVEDYSS